MPMTLAHTETSRKPPAVAAASAVPWGRGAWDGGASDAAFAGPAPPPKWAGTLHQLAYLARAPVSPPLWWTPRTAFCGNVETGTNPSSYCLEGMNQSEPGACGFANANHFGKVFRRYQHTSPPAYRRATR